MGDTVHEQIIRSNKRMLEAMAPADELRAAALKRHADTGRWTSRRFRVEGSRGGNSFLVGKKRAESIQAKMGGRVVDVVGKAPPKVRTTKAEEAAAFLPACPSCGVAAGKPCVRRAPLAVTQAMPSKAKASTVKPHKKRVDLHEAEQIDRNRELGKRISAGPARTADGAAELPG